MLGKDPAHLAPLPGVSASVWISAKSDYARGRHGSRAHCEDRWHHDNEAQANPASAEHSAANMSGSLTWRVCRPMAGSQGCTKSRWIGIATPCPKLQTVTHSITKGRLGLLARTVPWAGNISRHVNPMISPLFLAKGFLSAGTGTQQSFTSGTQSNFLTSYLGRRKHADVDFVRRGNHREFISAA